MSSANVRLASVCIEFHASGMRLAIPIATFVLSMASPIAASPYVFCDNGLRCFVAPCPSTNAYDIGKRKLLKGIYSDICGMTAGDRARIEQSNGLYDGSLVISAHMANRTVKTPAGPRTLPHLIGKSVQRNSTAREQLLCRGK